MATRENGGSNRIGGVLPDGTRVSARAMIRADPTNAAAISKLTHPLHQSSFTSSGELKIGTPSIQHMRERGAQVAGNIRDAENIMATMPDIEMMAQLLISAIQSPHDNITKEIVIESGMDLLSSELKAALVNEVKQYFEHSYRIKDQIQGILEDMLVHFGSHCSLVLPENALDELINGRSNYSEESLHSGGLINKDGSLQSLGLLANPYVSPQSAKLVDHLSQDYDPFSSESVDRFGWQEPPASTALFDRVRYEDEHGRLEYMNLRVTDNVNVLRMPSILERRRQEQTLKGLERSFGAQVERGYSLEDIEGFGGENSNMTFRRSMGFKATCERGEATLESLSDYFGGKALTDREMRSLVYKQRHRTNDTIRVIRTQDQLARRSIGEPLVLKIPSEAFIPVFVPGQEYRQVGAYILIDATGNFMTSESLKDLSGAYNTNSSNQSFASSLLARVKSNYIGNFDCSNPKHQQELIDSYTQVIEADFMARLRNTTHGSSVRIATNQEIYRIMLIRHLAGNMTQALWVPRELFTYFAFDFNNAGIGRSILDKIKVLASIRAIVTMANVKASIRNSIGETVVEVTLDERDPDPVKTQELLWDMMARTRQEAMPIGVQNPADITEWLSRAGIRMTFSGHPGLPQTQIQSRQEGMQYVKPDVDLMEYLEKYIAKAFGLTPEQIDNAHQPEHATTIVANSLSFAKRVINYQEKFNPLLSDHCRKICFHSQAMFETIVNTIARGFDQIELTAQLREHIDAHPGARRMLVETVSRDFINTLNFELPEPKNVRIQNQLEEMRQVKELAQEFVDNYMADVLFDPNVVGDQGPEIARIMRESIMSRLMRDHMNKSGVFADLITIITDRFSESDLNTGFEADEQLMRNAVVAYVTHVARNLPIRRKIESAVAALDIDAGVGGGYDDSTSMGTDPGSLMGNPVMDGGSDTGDDPLFEGNKTDTSADDSGLSPDEPSERESWV